MVNNSVFTAIDCRGGDGDHFPLNPAEIGFASHQVGIQIIMCLHGLWIQAVYFYDVIYAAPIFPVFIV